MKIKNLFIVFLLTFLFLFVLNCFSYKKESILYKKSSYTIRENFIPKNDEFLYEFFIEKGEDQYYYQLKEKKYQKKKLIRKIKTYRDENITCIVPIYKNKDSSSIYCLEDGVQVSNYYLKENNHYQKILEKVKNVEISDYSESNFREYERLKVYNDHIEENEVFYLWNYKGVYVLNHDENSNYKFLDFDLYDNVMSVAIHRYFVLFDNSSVKGIQTIYYYDSIKNKVNSFSLKEPLSKKSYINGVENQQIYVTDPKKKKQYRISIEKERIEEVGNEIDYYILFENHQKKMLNTSDFFMKKQYFDNVKQKYKETGNLEDVVKEDTMYYYFEGNHFYRKREGYGKELLFDMNDVVEWKVVDGKILLLKDDMVYCYSDSNGLRKIVQSLELNYNYSNIYHLGS